MKRCSPGTRRNKKTGICDEYVPKNKTLKASVTKEKKMNAAMVKAMAKKIAAQYNYPEGTLSDYSAKQEKKRQGLVPRRIPQGPARQLVRGISSRIKRKQGWLQEEKRVELFVHCRRHETGLPL